MCPDSVSPGRRARLAAWGGALLLLLLLAVSLVVVISPLASPDASDTRAETDAPAASDRRRVKRQTEPVDSQATVLEEPSVDETAPPRHQRRLQLDGIVLDASGDAARAGVEVAIVDALTRKPIARVQTEDGGWWTLDALLDAAISTVRASAIDSVDDRRSGEGWADVWHERERCFLVLRLRPLVSVAGRVVDSLGVPVPGVTVHVQGDRSVGMARTRSDHADHSEDVVVVESGPDGGFLARVRAPGSTVRAFGIGADGVWGLDVADSVREGREIDLGDIALPGDGVTRWRIAVRDAEGRPCANAIVRFVGPEFAYTESHPDYDEARFGLVVGDDGVVEFAFASGRAPVVLAIGGGWFVPRQFAVERSTAGDVSATVTLVRRAVAVVRFGGLPAAASDIDDLFLQVEADTAAATRAVGTVDIRTGAASSGSHSAYAEPLDLLHDARNPSYRWISDDEVEIVTDAPGDVNFALSVEAVDVSSGTVKTGVPTLRHAVEIGPGRLVRLDLSALATWDRDPQTPTWVPRVAVWPHRGDAAVAAGGAFTGDADITGFIVLRRDEGVRPGLAVVAVPPGVEQLAVGTVRDGKLNGERSHRRHAFSLDALLDLPSASGEALVVPVPKLSAALLGTVRVRVRYAGSILRRSGIPLQISGRDDANLSSAATAWTDADGAATFRVAPGTYAVAPSWDIAVRDPLVATWQTVAVSQPGQVAKAVVELAWPRE